jgi:hypothetical protein
VLCEGSFDWDEHGRIAPERPPLAQHPPRETSPKSRPGHR